MLQEQLGLSEPEAFRWIQKTAMDLRLSMRQVAEGVVEHGPQLSSGETPDLSRRPEVTKLTTTVSGASRSSDSGVVRQLPSPQIHASAALRPGTDLPDHGGSMIRPTRTWRVAAVVAAAATLVLTACGSDVDDAGDDARSSDSELDSRAAKGDGTLTIGTLLPQTGDLAFLGPPEFAGVDLPSRRSTPPAASRQARSSDQRRLRRRHARHRAARQVDKLLNARTPTSSSAPPRPSVSLSVIDKITGAGVVQFSPANTAPALRHLRRQGPVLPYRAVRRAPGRGARQPRGRGRQQERRRSWPARTPTVRVSPSSVEEGARGDGRHRRGLRCSTPPTPTNYTAEVNKIAAAKPDAIVLVAFEETTKIIPQLIAKGVGPQDIQIYFVDGNTRRLLRRRTFDLDRRRRATFPAPAEPRSDVQQGAR